MNKPFLPLTALVVGLSGLSLTAHAQADESWYQNALKHNASIGQRKPAQLKSSNNSSKQASSTSTGARNIVNACDVMLNGNFESQLTIPSHVNNMGGDYAGSIYGGTNRPEQLSNWYSPTAGSPDYFATNAAANSEVQPSNENSPYGSFTPYLGTSNGDGLEGAIGLYARQAYYDSNTNTDRDRTSEYAQIDLNRPLPEGKYYVDFQVSLSHNTSYSLATNYGVNNGFGLVFTNTSSLSITSSGALTPTLSSRDFLAVPATAPTVFNQSPIAQNAVNYGVTGAANWQRVSGQILSPGDLRYVTVGLFNADPNNQVALPNRRADLRNSYFFVDAIRIFKIPTAGANQSVSCSGSAILGEGCSIPGATYTWSAPGVTGLPVNSTTIQVTVKPSATTTYTLAVTLPDGTVSTSSTTVTTNPALPPAPPVVSQFGQQNDNCRNTAHFRIRNFDPNATYSFIRGENNPSYLSPTLTGEFIVKVSGGIDYATFKLTVTNQCGVSSTSDFFEAYYQCEEIGTYRTANSTTAYPNPVAESLTLPQGVKDATLLDDKGRPVQKTNKAGQLDVQSLPDGLYNLQMMQSGKLINQRIQVKH